MNQYRQSGPTEHTAFQTLGHTAFQTLEHAAYLKGLLRPFKGKGELEDWASHCIALRDDLASLAQRRVLPQAGRHPFNRLPVQLAHQSTGAGTTFLRWRNADRSAMGVALWEALVVDGDTPASLISDLLAMEEQRIVLNMQVSLLHTIARQAVECAGKMQHAHDVCARRMAVRGNAGRAVGGTAR